MEHLKVFDPEKQRAEFTSGAFDRLVKHYPRLTKEIADDLLNECSLVADYGETDRFPGVTSYRKTADYYIELEDEYLEYGITSDGQEHFHLHLQFDDDGIIFNFKDIE